MTISLKKKIRIKGPLSCSENYDSSINTTYCLNQKIIKIYISVHNEVFNILYKLNFTIFKY